MKKYDQHVIIKSLNNSIRILRWDINSFILLMMPFFFALIFRSLSVMLVALVARVAINRLMRRMPVGLVARYGYWVLPSSLTNRLLRRAMAPSHLKRYLA